MKKFLPLALLIAQVISCGTGTIEMQPEATKLKIQNRSTINLINVRWNGHTFGNIGANDFKEAFVSEGTGPVSFEIENGETYHTCGSSLAKVEKYRNNEFPLGNSTPLENSKYNCMQIKLGDLGQIGKEEEPNEED